MYYELKLVTKVPTTKGEKTVVEQYICERELFGEAELAGLEQHSECDVVSIQRSKVRELVNCCTLISEDEHIYRAVLTEAFEIDGKEKEQRYQVLVCAKSLEEANKFMKDYMEQGLNGMSLDSLQKTKIIGLI